VPQPDWDKADVTITLGEDTYVVRLGEITPALARSLRDTLGYSARKLVELIGTDPDIDVLAGIVWLARLQRGESKVTYDEVASKLTWVDMSQVDIGSGLVVDEGEDLGEALAVN
jgi:hypothetical protein